MNTTLNINRPPGHPEHRCIRPAAISKRAITTHQIFGTTDVALLPAEFDVGDVVGPVNQGTTDFCQSYCVRELASDQDKVAYDENFSIAATSRIVGSPIMQGAPAIAAMQGAIDFGLLLPGDVPAGMTWQQAGALKVATWQNWAPPIFLKAAPHERAAFLPISGPYDMFDNVRSNIFQHKRSVAMATKWYYDFNFTPSTGLTTTYAALQYLQNFSYHMYPAKGWKVINGTTYIKTKPLVGLSGDQGSYYFDRPTTNILLADPQACALIFSDIPQSVVDRMALQHQSLRSIFDEMLARVFGSGFVKI